MNININIDEIVEELQQRIRERRIAGEYPEGLELQLEAEFKGMMRAVDRNEIDLTRLSGLIGSVNGATHAVNSEVGTDSRIPGGPSAHAVIGRIVERHTGPLAESVRRLGFTIATALDESRRLFEAQNVADERQLYDAISGVLDRLAVLDHLVEISRDLEERLARLERERPRP